MSKIALSGNASGTGTFTIASPNSNSDRTLNLPDAAGTIQVSGNPISGTTGSFSGDLSFNSGYGSAAVAYGCRAWVNFNGTGTPAIREDGNVSSITDNGTGDYTVNFATAMPDANYGCFGWTTGDSTGDPTRHTIIYGSFASGAAGKTTSGLRVQSAATDANVFVDSAEMNVSIIR